MHRKLIKLMLLPGLMVVSTWVQAQDFDLDSAVSYALEHNPDLNAAQQQLDASSAQLRSSRAGFKPSVTVSTSARVSDNPLDAFADKLNTRQVTTQAFDPAVLNHPGSSDMYFTQLALRWPVYTGGRVAALVDAAKATELNRRLQYQRDREYTAFATTRAYLSVLSAKKGLVIAQDAVDAAQHHANTTSRLASQGRIVESDKLAAEVNLAALQSAREQASTHYKNALDGFKLVVGIGFDSEVNLLPVKIQPLDAGSDVAVYEKQSLDMRKDLAAIRAEIQAAQSRVDAARSAHKPSINIVASTNWYDDKLGLANNSSSIMGVLSFDLYDGQRDGKIDVAMAQQRETQWRYQSLEQAVKKQVRDAYNALLESKARLAIAESNVAVAKRAVKLVNQRYGEGRTILLDLLQSEKLYTGTRIEQLTAEMNLQLAEVALPLAAGTSALPIEGAK
jgi:outer membrane protein TolC